MDNVFDKSFKVAVLLKLSIWALIALSCYLTARFVRNRTEPPLSEHNDPYLANNGHVEDSLALRFL
jgi:hypothetical protein